METITGIRGKQFSNKELIIATGQLILRFYNETIFLETLAIFFPSSGNAVFSKILHSD